MRSLKYIRYAREIGLKNPIFVFVDGNNWMRASSGRYVVQVCIDGVEDIEAFKKALQYELQSLMILKRYNFKP